MNKNVSLTYMCPKMVPNKRTRSPTKIRPHASWCVRMLRGKIKKNLLALKTKNGLVFKGLYTVAEHNDAVIKKRCIRNKLNWLIVIIYILMLHAASDVLIC